MKWLVLFLSFCSMAYCNETRTKIAIIDTGVSSDPYFIPYLCEAGHKDFTNTDLDDRHGHGSLVASLITDGIDSKKYCILILKWNDPRNNTLTGTKEIIRALHYALSQKVSYINMSLAGYVPVKIEKFLLKRHLENGTKLIIAAGNDNVDLSKNCDYYPACYFFSTQNVYVVGNAKNDILQDKSNYGGPINSYEDGHMKCFKNSCMNGTSMSTAIKTNKLLSSPHI